MEVREPSPAPINAPFPKRHLLIIALLAILHIQANYYTVRNSFFFWDDGNAWQVGEAKDYCGIVQDRHKGGLSAAAEKAIVTGIHPQLYQLCLGAVASLRPPAQPKDFDLPVQALNSLSLIIILLSTYGIGARIYDPRRGLLAAVLLSFCPVFFGQMRLPALEIPLTAAITLFFYLLLKSGQFKSRLISLLSGIALGTAFLIKETAAVVVAAPLFAYCIPIADIKQEKRRRIINLVIMLGTAFLTAAPVYLNHHSNSIYSGAWHHFLLINQPDPFYYFKAFPEFYIGLIAIMGTVPLLVNYLLNIRRRTPLLTFWLFYPLLVFMFCGYKAVRYMVPAMPALFLIISNEVFDIFSSRAKLIYPAALTALFSFQYVYLNLFLKGPNHYYRPYSANESGLLTVKQDKMMLAAEETISSIARRHPPGDELRFISMSRSTYELYLITAFKIRAKRFSCLQPKPGLSMQEWISGCSAADCLLETVEGPGKILTWLPDLQTYRRYRNACMPFFELTQVLSEERGKGKFAKLFIYKRKAK